MLVVKILLHRPSVAGNSIMSSGAEPAAMDAVIDRIRRPAYTGEKRCWPCTLVNVSLLGAGCVVLALLTSWIPAVAAGVAGGVVIWLRGYLVPYTPRFAPRLVARLPGDPFHADGGSRPADPTQGVLLASSDEPIDGEQLLEHLIDAGVIEVAADGEQLVLAEDVSREWEAEMDTYREMGLAELADAVEEINPEASVEAVSNDTDEWVRINGYLQNIPVVVADLAAAKVLESRLEDPAIRTQAVEHLRLFLDSCPTCGTDVVETSELDCCGGAVNPRSAPNRVRACPSCDTRLFTYASE